MRVSLALREDPARVVILRKARVAARIRRCLREWFAFRIEELEAERRDTLAAREREEMQKRGSAIAFPNRAQIRQLHQCLRADAFPARRQGIKRFRG